MPDELLNPVVAYFNPLRVGEAGPDSDYVVDDDTPVERLTLAAGYEAQKPYRRAADVFPCREQTFAKKSRVVGSLRYTAAAEGVVVYERP